MSLVIKTFCNKTTLFKITFYAIITNVKVRLYAQVNIVLYYLPLTTNKPKTYSSPIIRWACKECVQSTSDLSEKMALLLMVKLMWFGNSTTLKTIPKIKFKTSKQTPFVWTKYKSFWVNFPNEISFSERYFLSTLLQHGYILNNLKQPRYSSLYKRNSIITLCLHATASLATTVLNW